MDNEDFSHNEQNSNFSKIPGTSVNDSKIEKNGTNNVLEEKKSNPNLEINEENNEEITSNNLLSLYQKCQPIQENYEKLSISNPLNAIELGRWMDMDSEVQTKVLSQYTGIRILSTEFKTSWSNFFLIGFSFLESLFYPSTSKYIYLAFTHILGNQKKINPNIPFGFFGIINSPLSRINKLLTFLHETMERKFSQENLSLESFFINFGDRINNDIELKLAIVEMMQSGIINWYSVQNQMIHDCTSDIWTEKKKAEVYHLLETPLCIDTLDIFANILHTSILLILKSKNEAKVSIQKSSRVPLEGGLFPTELIYFYQEEGSLILYRKNTSEQLFPTILSMDYIKRTSEINTQVDSLFKNLKKRTKDSLTNIRNNYFIQNPFSEAITSRSMVPQSSPFDFSELKEEKNHQETPFTSMTEVSSNMFQITALPAEDEKSESTLKELANKFILSLEEANYSQQHLEFFFSHIETLLKEKGIFPENQIATRDYLPDAKIIPSREEYCPMCFPEKHSIKITEKFEGCNPLCSINQCINCYAAVVIRYNSNPSYLQCPNCNGTLTKEDLERISIKQSFSNKNNLPKKEKVEEINSINHSDDEYDYNYNEDDDDSMQNLEKEREERKLPIKFIQAGRKTKCCFCQNYNQYNNMKDLQCGHYACTKCLYTYFYHEIKNYRKIEEANKENKLLSDIICISCKQPIDYIILEKTNPTSAEQISFKTWKKFEDSKSLFSRFKNLFNKK